MKKAMIGDEATIGEFQSLLLWKSKMKVGLENLNQQLPHVSILIVMEVENEVNFYRNRSRLLGLFQSLLLWKSKMKQ